MRVAKREVERDLKSLGLEKLEDRAVVYWARRALLHWAEHRPKMYRQLKAQGKLREAVLNAGQRTADVESELILKGMDPYQAEELVREMWVLLPSEQDVPRLGEGRDPLSYAHGIYGPPGS